MNVSSKYIPVDIFPEVEAIRWFACWCAECQKPWLMGAMQERVACPYCTAIIEPSTVLWTQGGGLDGSSSA